MRKPGKEPLESYGSYGKILEFFEGFVYTVTMQAFMPQKDTALLLARAARAFISSFSTSLPTPRFPLYAFAESLPGGGYRSCSIGSAEREGDEFYFPVELTYGEGAGERLRLKIVFAELESGCTDSDGTPSGTDQAATGREDAVQEKGGGNNPAPEGFPLRPRVFRTGRVEFSGNSWEIWDERWHKLQS